MLGSPAFQLVYDSGVLVGLHTHVPSDAASVPPIHTELPAAAVSSSAFCSADCTLANWRPAAWQSALASAHERASLMSVKVHGGAGSGGGGGQWCEKATPPLAVTYLPQGGGGGGGDGGSEGGGSAQTAACSGPR